MPIMPKVPARVDKEGDIELNKLPSTENKPKLIHGFLAELQGVPIIKNFSHVIRWMFENFTTKKEIEELVTSASGSAPSEESVRQMVTEEVERQLAAKNITADTAETISLIDSAVDAIGSIEDAATVPPPDPATIPEGLSLVGLYQEVEALRKAFLAQSSEAPAEEP